MTQEQSTGKLITSIMSGDSHFVIADSFLQSMPYETIDIVKNMHENWGMVFATATNLSLAVELYIKACLITHNVKFKTIHDLKELFNSLPYKVKTKIKADYRAYNPRPNNPFDKKSAIDMCHSIKSARAKKHDLESVLNRSKDSFTAYRYLFESIENSSTKSIKFEYGALWCAARAIRKQLASPAVNVGDQQRILSSPFAKKTKLNTLQAAIGEEIYKKQTHK